MVITFSYGWDLILMDGGREAVKAYLLKTIGLRPAESRPEK
jgi:hypothetical protein